MKAKVFKIVGQIMQVPANQLNEESSPDTVEKWDSLKHMNLILALEEEFNIQFTDTEIVEMLSVGLILEALENKDTTGSLK